MTAPQQHADWCDLDSCTAYVDGDVFEPEHRSRLVLVDDFDGGSVVALWLTQEPDGGEVDLELAVFPAPLNTVWWATEPLEQVGFRVDVADGIRHALGSLVKAARR